MSSASTPQTLGRPAVGVAWRPWRTLVWAAAMLAAAPLAAGQVTFAPADGGRLFDSLHFGDRRVLREQNDAPGAGIRLTRVGEATLDSLFQHQTHLTLLPRVTETTRDDADTIRQSGVYAHEDIALPFTRTIRQIDPATIEVSEQVAFDELDPVYRVADHYWVLPLAVHEDEHQRMLAFGGANRVEMFRMDMNDVQRREMNISDSRGYMPYWDIGGVEQRANGYTIWKTNHDDTMAYPLDEGTQAPGWADYSEDDWGISVEIVDPDAAAPWAIRIDARRGELTVFGHPPSQPARSGAALGSRTTTFRIVLHETSWPAFHPCELDVALYEELFGYLSERYFSGLMKSIFGTNDPHSIIHRQRIQPSVALRTLYRGDDWRMGNLMKDIGASFQRNPPMPEREERAQRFLDHVREHGVPSIKQ